MERAGTRVAPTMGSAALAGAIRNGEVTARSALEACIQRIEEVDPLINAVVQRRFDLARAEADRADAELAADRAIGPFRGVPITIKDQYRVGGLATTLGPVQRKGTVEDSDGPVVARLHRAGAIVLGKTNVSQMLLQNDADDPAFGRTSNLWDLSRTPGGSSGGEAAVIAYGGSSLGLGGDFGGGHGRGRHAARLLAVPGGDPGTGPAGDRGRIPLTATGPRPRGPAASGRGSA